MSFHFDLALYEWRVEGIYEIHYFPWCSHILRNARRVLFFLIRFARGGCIFVDKRESHFFENCHQGFVHFGGKTHKFLISVDRKKRESWDSLDSPLCFSDRLSKKKISDNSWKKSKTFVHVTYMFDIAIHFFGHIANCFFSSRLVVFVIYLDVYNIFSLDFTLKFKFYYLKLLSVLSILNVIKCKNIYKNVDI